MALRHLRSALLLTALATSAFAEVSDSSCKVLDVADVGPVALTAWQHEAEPFSMEVVWVELGRDLLVCSPGPLPQRLRGFPVTREFEAPLDDLIVVQGFRRSRPSRTEVVASGGRYAVVRRATADLYSDLPTGHGHTELFEVPWNQVLVRRGENRAMAPRRGGATPAIDALVASVDGPRWLADVATLAGWDRKSTRVEIALAREWIKDQFEALPGLSVELDPFPYNGLTLHNVIGTLPGTLRPEDLIVVGGHYDSTGGSFSPGAEDNATGCAGVLEIARVFSAATSPVTMVFVCYSGEEQGLHGSYHQVDELQVSGDDDRVVHMLNMDMIGYTADADLDCLLETEDEFADLLDPYASAAANYTSLRIETSLFAFGSDHVPFIQGGMPALLTIENDWDQYPDYHSSGDTVDNVDLQMGYQTLRMNVAALADLMEYGSGLFFDGFESGDLTAWD